jgi:erythromycin esterase
VARQGFTWGFGAFAENQELITWMRNYNADPSPRQKLHFYGIDLSLGGAAGSIPTPFALTQALSYLKHVDAPAGARFEQRFNPYLKLFPDLPLTPEQSDALSAAIDDLVALIERERSAFTAASSADEFEYGLRDAMVAQQSHRVFRVLPAAAPGVISPEVWQAMSARDVAMAENVRWALGQEGPAGRMLLFAHNSHVKNAPTRGGIWSGLSRSPAAMGSYLKSSLGESVLTIGSASHEKSARVPVENSFDEALATVGLSQFILDLRAARTDPAATAWLREDRNVRTNGDTFLTLKPGLAFDAVLYWDKLTPSHASK